MSDLYILKLASQQTRWLSAREALTASNIANANTPGFRARDIQPFADTISVMNISMALTDKAHLAPDGGNSWNARPFEMKEREPSLSGNSVDLEHELAKIGDIGRAYSLNTNIKRVIHQMLSASVK